MPSSRHRRRKPGPLAPFLRTSKYPENVLGYSGQRPADNAQHAGVHPNRNFLNVFRLFLPVQISVEKFSAFLLRQITCLWCASRAPGATVLRSGPAIGAASRLALTRARLRRLRP
jgi:hypothetical protein